MSWTEKQDEVIQSVAPNNQALAYAQTNADAVHRAVAGHGPDHPTTDPSLGARMVCNISAAHVPAFVEASSNTEDKPYKNGYDLEKYRVGGVLGEPLKTRELVDAALPLNGFDASEVYFGAVELNGTGMRFYGDICLVLRDDALDRDTVVLDRNSFDLARSPLREQIDSAANSAQMRAKMARNLSGNWNPDLLAMSAIKVLGEFGPSERRLTTRRISDALLQDEDYLEVLRRGSFGVSELQEARTSAADAAQDAHVGQRSRQGPLPTVEALLWRARRRRAEAALRSEHCVTRVVVTSGRTR
jgi:hypothetical protein